VPQTKTIRNDLLIINTKNIISPIVIKAVIIANRKNTNPNTNRKSNEKRNCRANIFFLLNRSQSTTIEERIRPTMNVIDREKIQVP